MPRSGTSTPVMKAKVDLPGLSTEPAITQTYP